jgi:predicted HicB family RNase H-like nuclease
MARRKEINPHGSTRKLSVVVSEPVAEALHKEAAEAGKSVGAVMREKLEKAS